MSANNVPNERRRSRPVNKKNKFHFLKGQRLAAVLILIIFLVSIIAGSLIFFLPGETDEGNTNDNNPIAVIDTSMGTIKIELYQDKVPKTCENFIKLVNDDFYDGMIFYRILDDFMIQAGRYFPDGTEKISPYGNIEFETHPDVRHVDGAISMASTGAGLGGSAEFFICDGAQSFLDNSYAAFGVVVEGISIVRSIASQPHDSSSSAGGGKPYTDIIINSITIE